MPWSPTCLHSNHLPLSNLPKKILTPLVWITMQCNRKVRVNSSNIPVIFPKLCREIVGSNSWDFQMCPYHAMAIMTVNVSIAKLQVRIRLHCPSHSGLHYECWWFVSESTEYWGFFLSPGYLTLISFQTSVTPLLLEGPNNNKKKPCWIILCVIIMLMPEVDSGFTIYVLSDFT